MNVPFIDLSRSVRRIGHETVLADWRQVLEKTQFVGGEPVTQFEAKMQQKLGVKHFISCANGTDALMIALQAGGVGPGKKVALPNLTFWATYEAVAQVGAQPVLIDVEAEHLQMDLKEFKAAYERFRFDAAIFVHLLGWTSGELLELRRYCAERKIFLVEDGAQAFGVEIDGESVFKNAQIATHSFYPAKVLGGVMDGGGISMNDDTLADLSRRLCNHGRSSHYSYSHVGWNSRMGGVQAAWLNRCAPLIDEFIESRRKALALYENLLADENQIRLHRAPANVRGNAYLMVATLRQHDGELMVKKMKDLGIGCGRVYPETMDVQEPAKNALRVSDLGVSRAFCKHVINLPMFAYITDEEVHRSADSLKSALRT